LQNAASPLRQHLVVAARDEPLSTAQDLKTPSKLQPQLLQCHMLPNDETEIFRFLDFDIAMLSRLEQSRLARYFESNFFITHLSLYRN
jgi:hypothetical protein